MNLQTKDSLYKIIGKNIKVNRELAHLTQNELAEKLNLSRTSIVNIEKGYQHPYIHLLWEIAEIFNINISLLLPTKEEFKTGIQFDRALVEQSIKKKEDIENFDIFINKI